jgi:hypothetical protein
VQRNGGAWQLVRSWSTTTTYTFKPTQTGTYLIAIWARSAGSTANAWQAYYQATMGIVP